MISVVIPLYQKVRHVATALAGAFRSCGQANTAFELIVVDDGSTDGSGGAVQNWAATDPAHASALRLIRQENRGAAAARKLAQDGFQVAVMSSSGKGEALGRELGGIGLTGSNQSSEDLQKLVDQTMARWGRIDALVNSAGHGPKGPLLA
jgi:glycosyltransferase involved in cell wall biosynthesis